MTNSPYYKYLTQGMLFAGLVAIAVGGGSALIQGGLNSVSNVLLIIGALLLIGYLAASPELVAGAFRGRGLKYGGNTFAMVALVVVIVGAANWFTNSHSPSFDLTRDRLHTLTSQTDDILKNLHQDVKVTAFFQTGTEQEAKDLLAQYAARSPYIQYRFVDPDKDPATARQFGIVSYGTTVFQSGNNRKDVATVGEQEFTSAILTVTSTERRKIYFVVGNGQPDPTAADQQGFHQALLDLQNNNYVVSTLDATAPSVPDDAAAVILAAGSKPLLDGQKSAYSAYLGKGGKMLINSAAFSETDMNDILKPYGVQFLPGVTIDPASSLQQSPQVPAVARFATNSDIVKNVAVTLFPVSDGISTPQQPAQGLTITPIAKSSDQSWLVNRQDPSQWNFRQGTDTRGPITLMATIEGTLPASASAAASSSPAASPTPLGGLASPGAIGTPPPPSASSSPAASGGASASPQASAQPTQTPTPVPQVTGADVNLKGGTRIVAVAATRWMDDQFLDLPSTGNHDLFINSINYLVGNTALVSIPAKNAAPSQVVLLGPDANLIFFTTVVFIPLAVLILGGAVWWSRR
ncbi:MAG TPA: Gldg family protein [Chloroflexota bacterium]|nr:Gldg family protein [Chloroflexota bacterium]